MYEGKTKALISCMVTVTVQLICTFFVTYAGFLKTRLIWDYEVFSIILKC